MQKLEETTFGVLSPVALEVDPIDREEKFGLGKLPKTFTNSIRERCSKAEFVKTAKGAKEAHFQPKLSLTAGFRERPFQASLRRSLGKTCCLS